MDNIFRQLGSTNHAKSNRELFDFYATDPKAVKKILDRLESDGIKLNKNIWECAAGKGHMSDVLNKYGYNVYRTDIVDRGTCDDVIDFLSVEEKLFKGDIFTNPPFKKALPFLKKAMDISTNGEKIVFFLKIQFLEGIERGEFYKTYPPKYIYIHSSRVSCAKNGDFHKYKSSAMAYCLFVFEKGFIGETIIRWLD